uniref:Condensin complex subunit 1 C-terminal domain-containing protein n=1 Tax=Ditylenchus dipsaci TaxID=166011 RepID=A0A915CTU7_9BILA
MEQETAIEQETDMEQESAMEEELEVEQELAPEQQPSAFDEATKHALAELYEKAKIYSTAEITDDNALSIVVQGLLDRIPVVVCKAIRVVQSIISSRQFVNELAEEARKLMEEIDEVESGLNRPSQVPDSQATQTDQRVEELIIADSGEVISSRRNLSPVMEERLTPNPLMNILLARCEDEKVNPRKLAISTVEALFLYFKDKELVGAVMEKLEARCRDISLTVRKQAAESLTKLLQSTNGMEEIEAAWLSAVMNLIVDRELGVQQFCSRLISEVIITPIIQDSATDVTWRLLYSIEQQTGLRRLLLRCLVFQHRENNFPQRLVKTLEAKTSDEEHSNAAWMLLGELSAFLDVNPTRAADLWLSHINLNSSASLLSYISKILANRSKVLKQEQITALKGKMADALSLYKINSVHISSTYYAFARICGGIGEEASGSFVISEFNKTWFTKSLEELDSTIYSDMPLANLENTNMASQIAAKFSSIGGVMSEEDRKQCDKLVRIISSIGECVQYTPTLINKKIFKLLKVVIASDVLKGIRDGSVMPTPRTLSPMPLFNNIPDSQSTVAASEADRFSSVFIMKIDNRVLRAELLTRTVRAHAVLTLGKLCLQDEKLAKKCVPVFIRQLKVNHDHFVRNNIVVAVCDLCIRYTLLVDRYCTILASCLKDRSVLVRHQTLMLLTNLIKEQFLKWEGSIIYRFVTALLDPERCIRKYAEFCLVDILLVQYPMMFFNHFLECLFYFNDVKHQSWKVTDDDDCDLALEVKQKCSLEGDAKCSARMHLYKFMLKTFADDKKFSVCSRIASDIFGSIVDGSLSLEDNKVVNLLKDSFMILCSPDIKFSLQVGKKSEEDENDDEPPEAVKSAAKTFISSVFRKALVEALMPNLIVLKEFLVEKRSPLLYGCLEVISNLFKNYPEQIEDFLVSSPQQKAELEFDLKQLQAVT